MAEHTDTTQENTSDTPQIYLVTPPEPDLHGFTQQMAKVLNEVEIACIRLSLATKDEDRICRAADLIREQAHSRDIPLIIQDHFLLVEKLGLDGVHLTDGSRSVRNVRKEFEGETVIGAYCATSRHDGMTAGENGADYISFGPIGQTALGNGQIAEAEIFQWWSQMIELPVVAEGAITLERIETYAPYTDFFAIGEEIWNKEDPIAALKDLTAPLV